MRTLPVAAAAAAALVVAALGCGGGHPVWLAGGGVRGAGTPDAESACAAPLRAVVRPAAAACCAAIPSVGPARERPGEVACEPPAVGSDQVAVLACVPGDPSEVTGTHVMPDGTVAVLTEATTVCGGMARGIATAWWVTVPAHATAALVSCGVHHEDCSGPPRP